MRNHLNSLLALSFAVGAVALPVAAQDMDNDPGVRSRPSQVQGDPSADASKDAAFPAGVKMLGAEGEPNDIREALEEITELAVKENGFDQMVRRLVDRHRLGDIDESKFTQLNAITKQIRADWKAKYGHDFAIENDTKKAVFGGAIVHGEVTDGRALVDHWPVKAMGVSKSDLDAGPNAQPAGARDGAKDKTSTGEVRDDDRARLTDQLKGNNSDKKEDKVERKQLDNGQNVAIYTAPAVGELPKLTVSMVQDMTWHVDVPDSLTEDQLRSNLEKHLSMVRDSKAQWPADEAKAYQLVAHHVLMALYDTGSVSGSMK